MSKAKKGIAGALAAIVVATPLVMGWEGLSLKVYRDPIGILTYCWGETKGAKLGDTYTRKDCSDRLMSRLGEFDAGNAACVKGYEKLPVKVRASWISLSYNIGVGAFCKSTVARLANAGDLRGACDAMLRFNKAGGRVLKGLVNRRTAERKLCLEGL